MKVSVVAFDYGNTLVLEPFGKVMRLKAEDFLGIMRKEGYKIGKDRFIACWTKANKTVNYPFCSHFYQETPIIKNFLERIKVLKSDEERIAEKLLAAYREGLRIVLNEDQRIRDAKGVLKELKVRGKKLMVLTNDSADGSKNVFSWTGFDKFFERILVSERLGMEKPDLRIFKHLIKMSGAGKEEIVYVGDDPERDIKPSKEIGMKAILLKNPGSLSVSGWRNYRFKLERKHKPDFVIRDLRELLGIIH